MKKKKWTKMSKKEKRRHVAKCEQNAHAAQLAIECGHCGKAGKILNDDIPPLKSPPPLWLLKTPWLLQCSPLCSDCIELGARIPLCFEGGSLHHFWDMEGPCLDCGYDGEDTKGGAGEPALERARLEGAVCAREAEIGSIVRRMAIEAPPEPELTALTQYLDRLREDHDWTAGQLARC